MSDPVEGPDEVFEQLRREYLAEAPARLGELRKDLAAARAGEPDALASLKSRFHRLAGSGGSYGFPAITEAGRTAEVWLAEHPQAGEEDFALLGGFIGRVAAAFDDAAREVGFPSPAPRPPPFGWRAHVLGSPTELAAELVAVLRDAQYIVSTGPLDTDPADIPVSERPDLVVVVPAAPEDPEEALRTWLGGPFGAHLSAALVAAPGAAELLREPFGRLDLHVAPDRADTEVARWARAVGRAAGTPLSVLVVLAEDAERDETVASLEAAGILVASAASAKDALTLLRDEATPPDLVLVDWELPGIEARALTRELRRASQFALTPILGLTSFDSDTQREEALAAGADDLLVRPLADLRLVGTVVQRARRARRLEEVVRRDGLTGLLPVALLGDELELILAHARRGGEQLSFVLLDLDHFRRVNEQLGSRTGDAILTHAARAIRHRVRASDLVGRMGGEEFGMVLRSCGPAQARVIADEIRATLINNPPLVEGVGFPVRGSAGVAAYPDHALTARDLMLAAEHALREAKETGRDRVVVAGDKWQAVEK